MLIITLITLYTWEISNMYDIKIQYVLLNLGITRLLVDLNDKNHQDDNSGKSLLKYLCWDQREKVFCIYTDKPNERVDHSIILLCSYHSKSFDKVVKFNSLAPTVQQLLKYVKSMS